MITVIPSKNSLDLTTLIRNKVYKVQIYPCDSHSNILDIDENNVIYKFFKSINQLYKEKKLRYHVILDNNGNFYMIKKSDIRNLCFCSVSHSQLQYST